MIALLVGVLGGCISAEVLTDKQEQDVIKFISKYLCIPKTIFFVQNYALKIRNSIQVRYLYIKTDLLLAEIKFISV